ncbi:uncharacterized protein LOC120124223 [Hibiscus syriacus]|uniref:uncharacterized protein LOC120124223 n=1 Tax=Hibiscus syriacus TaxID=106335 RepID=UPI0019222542|nr:uncharacterized protein LOC120124223 [Hibiscus syriacus]
MIVAFWNVRGINNPLKQRKILRRLVSFEVDVVCLMESRIRRDGSIKFISSLSSDWNIAENYNSVEGGRLWILWRKNLLLSVLRKCDQAITLFGTVDGHRTGITAIYGSNHGVLRRDLWIHLKTVANYLSSFSWVVGGDFNIIASPEESSDFDVMGVHFTPDMREFQEFLDDLELMDHPFLGPLFTWSNRQEGSFLAKKLDRILVNSQWMLDFPESFVEFKAQGVSDHCLGLLWSKKGCMSKRPRPFKFFNCWTGHEQFLSTVLECWQVHCEGNPMQCLFRKLKRLKPCLKILNKEFFSDISGRVSSKRSELEQLQVFNLSHVDQRRLDYEKIIQAELVDLEVAESEFYRQRAKMHWLKEGDLNTRFFHQKVESNKKKNTIRVIMSEEGQCFDSFDEMAAELVNFFTGLIGSTDPMVRGCSSANLKELG